MANWKTIIKDTRRHNNHCLVSLHFTSQITNIKAKHNMNYQLSKRTVKKLRINTTF